MNTQEPLEAALLSKQRAAELEKRPSCGLYLFLSIDIHEGTHFKSVNAAWPKVFGRFVNDANIELLGPVKDRKSLPEPRWHFWKQIGDEVLYFLILPVDMDDPDIRRQVERLIHFRGEMQIPEISSTSPLRPMLEVLKDRIYEIYDKQADISRKLHLQNQDGTKNVIALKSTVWLAEVRHTDRASVEMDALRGDFDPKDVVRNFVLNPGEAEEKDFLGPDIDLGFRVAKFAHRRKVIVSATVAHCLYRYWKMIAGVDEGAAEEGMNHLKIVSFNRLKGVWSGREYPIIWFDKEWENTRSGTFFYYEEFQDGAIAQIVKNLKNGLGVLPVSTVETVLKDLPFRDI